MISRTAIALTCRAFVLMAGFWVAPLLVADDVDSLDKELLDSLEGNPPADSPVQIVPRLIETTKTTAKRLKDGKLDEETTALQGQILADIDAILKQSAPPDQPPSSSSSPSNQQSQEPSSQQQDQSPEDSQSQQDEQNDPNAAAKESEQRTTAGENTDVANESRLGMSTSAWGHLPPKVREQMRSSFAEEYLPEYDALVRRYYEALARRRSSERDRRERD